MPHPHRALGRDVPHVQRQRHEVVGPMLLSWGSPSRRRSLGLRARPKRPLLATMTRSVTSRSTGLAAERNEPQAHEPLAPSPFCHTISPRGSRCRSSCRMRHDVGRQAAIRLAPEVGHVDRDAAAGLEHPLALGEDVAQQRQVLDVGPGHPRAVELLLVLLAGEVRRRGDDEGDRVVRQRVHAAGVTAQAGHPGLVRGHVLVGAELGGLEAGVEGVGDVRLAAPDTEIGGGGATAGRHGRFVRTLPAGSPGRDQDAKRRRGHGRQPTRTAVTGASATSRRRRRRWDVRPGRRASGPGRCTAGCASRPGPPPARCRPASTASSRARPTSWPRADGATKRSSR